MAIVGDFFRHNLTEFLQESPSAAPELHVLAVDDSLVDRKVIERLLKISSCKGDPTLRITSFFFFVCQIEIGSEVVCVCLEWLFFSDGCGEWNACSSVFGLGRRDQFSRVRCKRIQLFSFWSFFFMLIVEIGWC